MYQPGRRGGGEGHCGRWVRSLPQKIVDDKMLSKKHRKQAQMIGWTCSCVFVMPFIIPACHIRAAHYFLFTAERRILFDKVAHFS